MFLLLVVGFSSVSAFGQIIWSNFVAGSYFGNVGSTVAGPTSTSGLFEQAVQFTPWQTGTLNAIQIPLGNLVATITNLN